MGRGGHFPWRGVGGRERGNFPHCCGQDWGATSKLLRVRNLTRGPWGAEGGTPLKRGKFL